jgi:S-adenosylmethionine decarboxylase
MDINEDFGHSLHLDLYNADCSIIRKERLIEFIEGFIEEAGMKIHGDIHVDHYHGVSQDTEGWSAQCFLTSSSFSIHTTDYTKRVYIDLFSCKNVIAKRLANYAKEFWKTDYCSYVLMRR